MKRSISVPGVGRVLVQPDIATIRLGVNVTHGSAVAARESAAETMNKVLDAVLEAGVERRDIRTATVSLNAVTDYSAEGGPRVTGYQVANVLSVTLRDLDQTGQVIDDALWAGASSLDSLEFGLADDTAPTEQARAAAMKDARARALTIAGAAGATLGNVVAVSEGEQFRGPTPFSAARAASFASAAGTPIESGTQEVSVALTVTFELGK